MRQTRGSRRTLLAEDVKELGVTANERNRPSQFCSIRSGTMASRRTYLIMHRSRRSQRISASAEQSLQYTYGRVMAHASGVYDTLSNCGQPNPVVADITRRRSDSKNGLRMIGNP
jgi:hypothetical protein